MYIKLLQMIYVHKDIHIYRINTFTKLYLYTHTTFKCSCRKGKEIQAHTKSSLKTSPNTMIR